MATTKKDIYVFAHWKGLKNPQLIGTLSALYAKGKKAFSFSYDKNWLKSNQQFLLDPDIDFYTGPQFPNRKDNFGVFLDSMPDTWGKTLMKRKAFQEASLRGEKPKTLYEIDYLLGVYDESRMGALRFKADLDGDFLDNDDQNPTPPWSSVRELQVAVQNIENNTNNKETRAWLDILLAPGSSLGGARPKANILDSNQNLWIAKFPSKNDNLDMAAWEYLAYKLAIKAKIEMSKCKIDKVVGDHHTFYTKRFDREKHIRIHFTSAMAMTGNSERTLKENPVSYLDIAECIQNYGVKIEANLKQLWRRIIFNIAISNTDDHLRNHGFLLRNEGWELSPAYDLNPSIEKDGLALNIDLDNNALSYDLAKSVGEYFRLNNNEMLNIIQEVKNAVSTWNAEAKSIGIAKKDIDLMKKAFNF